MISKRLSQYLLSVAVVATTGIACSSGLRDYTQVELKVENLAIDSAAPSSENAAAENAAEETASEAKEAAAEAGKEAVDVAAVDTEAGTEAETEAEIAQTLAQTKAAIEKRLSSLNIETAEVVVQDPDQVVVRLPQAVPAEAVIAELVEPNRLTLRRQKPDTESALAENIETLQRLLVEQNNLNQTDKAEAAAALQPTIDETRSTILGLFEPGEITGEMLSDSQAVQMSGFNVWEVQIWFNAEGKQKFAEKTKALAGTGRAIGIFLDDVLLSAPIVDVDYADEGITDGASVISGNFTAEAAKELEQQLKLGALPADLSVVSVTSSEQTTEEQATEEQATEEQTTED